MSSSSSVPPLPLDKENDASTAPATAAPSVTVASPSPSPNKYPYHMKHLDPADDPLATRTLFVGNLEYLTRKEELFPIFAPFGNIHDIDVKRPLPGAGNAFAFITFDNLDQANQAKRALSGVQIGRFQMKIGYGKKVPCRKIWVGGVYPNVRVEILDKKFNKFGKIEAIEITGDQAFITFATVEAAEEAVDKMRGTSLGGNKKKKLRTDFARFFPPPNPHFNSNGPRPGPSGMWF